MAERLDLPRFSIQERDTRWENIRREMAAQGLNALVVFGNSSKWDSGTANVRYLTHVGGNGEEALVVFPLEGEPTCFLWAGGPYVAWWQQAQDWTNDIRPRPSKSWAAATIEGLRNFKLTDKKIGVVGLGGMAEPEGIFPYEAFRRIREALPRADFENSTEILECLRMVKSKEEVDFQRRAAVIAQRAIDVMAETARPGVKEFEIYAHMVHEMLSQGAEFPVMLLWQASSAPRHASRFPTSHPLTPGDIIVNEISPKYGGYFAHPHQPVVIGEPSLEVQGLFDACRKAFEAGMETLREGIDLRDASRAVSEPLREAGFTWSHPLIHGLGLSVPEFPSSSPDPMSKSPQEHIPIRRGMVLALQPVAASKDSALAIPYGCTVLIAEDGPIRLCPRPVELIVIH